MNITNPYLRLMRLHQPVGIWLLFWPCAWSLLLASGHIDLKKIILFFVGSLLMRSAGCIINDITDRNIDKHVERTKTRPIASGELSVGQGIGLLLVLLALSLQVAMQLGLHVVFWAALSLIPIAVYPFMKRITWWPQVFLGLVFNWGALMGWAAVHQTITAPAIFLYIGGVFLTLGYDTIYALQDRDDDTKIGVRSTALRLGKNIKFFVAVFYAAAILCFALAMGNVWGMLALILPSIHCIWQLYSLNINNPASAKRIFLSNIWLAALVFLAIYINILAK